MGDENADPNPNHARIKRKYTTVVDSAKTCVDKIKKIEDLSALKEYVDNAMEEKRKEQVVAERVSRLMSNPDMLAIVRMLECQCTVCQQELWCGDTDADGAKQWDGVVVHRCASGIVTMIHAKCAEAIRNRQASCTKCTRL
jgi:hypothetical protein